MFIFTLKSKFCYFILFKPSYQDVKLFQTNSVRKPMIHFEFGDHVFEYHIYLNWMEFWNCNLQTNYEKHNNTFKMYV